MKIRLSSARWLAFCFAVELLGTEVLAAPPARPWLGLSIGPSKGPVERGVLVREILPDSPSAGSDIRVGEEVLSLDGVAVHTPTELITQVQGKAIGAKLTLRVRDPKDAQAKDPKVREGRAVVVTLSARPDMRKWQRDALVGKQAPDFAPKVLSGPALASISSLRGEVVLVDYFASWCGPCMAAMPALSALSQKNVRVVAVSSETPDLINKVITDHKPPYTVAMDGTEEGRKAYRIHSFPTLVLIDRKGIVRLVSGDVEEVAQEASSLLAEPK